LLSVEIFCQVIGNILFNGEILTGFAKFFEKKEGACNFCYLLESWSCRGRSVLDGGSRRLLGNGGQWAIVNIKSPTGCHEGSKKEYHIEVDWSLHRKGHQD
jgi:hypothetical protein